ncbi:MAG: phage holin family protein [Bacteroidetes bacterium]|nr:phage holin family protein [Bacteroidota bacterium]
MAFEEVNEEVDQLQKNAQELIDSNLEFYKLKSFKILMKSSGLIAKLLFVLFFVTLFVVFMSIALALYLGKITESNTTGFLIVGGIYFVLGFVAVVFKSKLLERKLLRNFSEIFFND